MKLLFYIILTLIALSSGFANYINSINHFSVENVSKINNVFNIDRYTISIPDGLFKYPMGFSPGLGSGITLKEITSDGHIQLYGICDRGPNYTIVASAKDAKHTIIFPHPDFSPFIGIIDVVPKQSATLIDTITLTKNGQKITGLPPAAIHSRPEASIPTDRHFNLLPPNPNGFDTECIDFDAENFWIGDEYCPAIIKASRNSGEILEIFTPGNGLPEILSNGPQNRGFEALAVAPNGKIYAAMEGFLDFRGKTQDTASFIRIIELDPKTKQTRTLAFPFDKNTYTSRSGPKIGDLAAIDSTHFLLVEQGKTKSGIQNIIYIIDIADATDISNISTPDGKPIEYDLLEEAIRYIKFVKKSPLFDAQKHNWPHEKLEGIAILSPNKIAITQDNDFGFFLSINNINSERVDGYSVDYVTQKLLRHNKESKDEVTFHIDKKHSTELWIVEFKQNFLN